MLGVTGIVEVYMGVDCAGQGEKARSVYLISISGVRQVFADFGEYFPLNAYIESAERIGP
jgi:hypothetical protein